MKRLKHMPHIKMISFLVILLILSLTSVPDNIAEDYIDDSLVASSTAYLVARGVNATISLLQSVSLSIGFVSVSPGEILDPLNDLVERLSSVILFAIASLGIQKIMIEISGSFIIQTLLMLTLITLIVNYFFHEKFQIISKKNASAIYKILIFLLALRFSIPLMAISSGIIENIFIKNQVESSIANMEIASASANKLAMDIAGNDSSLEEDANSEKDTHSEKENEESYLSWATVTKEKAKEIMNSVSKTASGLNPKEKIIKINNELSKSIPDSLNLITFFVFKSLLLPILFLYIIIFATKRIYKYEFSVSL